MKIPIGNSLPAPPPASTTCNKDQRALEVLYLLDKFGVGDAFYHELAALEPSLPRSYAVKKERVELNKTFEIEAIPGYEGAFRSFTDTLQWKIANLVSNN